MLINGYQCKIDQDDGTYYPAILDEDGHTRKWHYFNSYGQALAYLRSETAKLAIEDQAVNQILAEE
jgi:hypothetical protein